MTAFFEFYAGLAKSKSLTTLFKLCSRLFDNGPNIHGVRADLLNCFQCGRQLTTEDLLNHNQQKLSIFSKFLS